MTRFSRNALMTEGDNAGKWGGGKVNNVNALNGNYQVNHIVPVELISDQRSIFRQIHNSNFRDDFLEIFDPSNVRSNGVALNIDLHNGSHPDYTRFVSEQIDVLLGKHGLNPSDTTTLSKAKLQAFATDLSDLTNKIRFLSSPTFLENPANTLKVNGAKVDIENAFDRAFGNNGQLESKEAKRYRALLSLDKEFMVLADTLGTEIVNGKRVFYGAEFLDGYIAFAKTKGIDIGTANFDSQAFKSLLRDANVREEMIGWLKDNGHDDALTGLSGLTARIKSTSISVRRLEDDRSREEVRAFRRAFRSLDSQLSSFLGEEYLDIAKKGLGKTALRIGGAALVAAASAPASFAMSLYDIGKLESETNGGLSELGYRAVTYARTRVDGSTESFSFIQRAYFPSSYLLSLSDAGLRRGDRNNYVIISRNDLDKKDVVLDILGVREGVLYERNDGDYIISQAPFHPNANLGDGELPIQDITISEEDIFRGTGDAFGNFVKSYDSYRSVASGFYANASHEVDGDGNLTISGTHRSDNADYFLGSNAYGYETNVNVASISNALADVGISGFDANSLQVIDFSTDPDLGGILRSVKIAVKAGDGRDVEAVLVDADKDGRLDMAQIIGRTDSGDLISEPASLLDGEGKWFDRYDYPGSEARLDFFQGLGGSIGSSIGNFLFDTDLGRLVGTPVLSSIGTFFGATLAGAIDSEATIGNALYETVDSLPSALSQALESSAIGQFSSALTAELMEGIGIEGVWGEVASTVTSTTISNIVTNVLDDGISAWNAGLDFGNLFDGSTYTSTGGEVGGTANVSSALASAVLNYAASAVADEVYTANTEIGSYAASVFGTVLGFVGSFYGGPLLGAAGQFVGQAGGAYAGDAYTWANDHQRYIGHHFGMTFGLFEAGAVLRLLGARPPKKPSAEAETHLSLESGYFVLGDVTSVAGGNEKFVRNLAESTRDSVNYIIGLVTENSEIAPNSNTSDLSYTFRHDHLGRVFLNGREVASANDAINAASIEAIENTEIKGGDLFIKRVIQNSSASSITAMSADLQIARDYGIYFRNKEVIDRAISAPYDSLSQSDKSFYVANSDVITRYMAAPKDHEGNLVQDQSLSLDVDDIAWLNETENGLLNKDRVLDLVPQLEVSQFAAGWIVTLQRASELGLDKAARSDFFGGMWGLADSIEIVTGANFHLEDLSISVQEGDLSVDYGGENSFVVSDAFANQTWMRVGAVATPTSETTDNRGTARARLLELARARHPNAELLNSPSVPYFEGATGNGTSIRGDVIISNGSGNFDIDDRHTEDWSALYEYHNGENVAGGFSPEQILPEDGVDTTLEIEGGDDVFIAGDGSNTLRGRSGHDWLDGKGGADTLHGDEGDDVLLGGTGDDTLNGGLGDDYLHGGAGADTVNGGDGNDLIVLSSGVDTVSAGAGDDTIFVDQTIISSSSSAGVDEVNAGSGSDTLSFARITQPWSNVNGSGAVISEDDEDYIAGIRFELAGGSVWYGVKVDGNKVVNYSGIENVEGSNFEDALTGNAEANRIWGRDGNDTLSGGAGNDVLQGGVGADQISGGDGNDTASYSDSSGAVWIDLQSEEYFGGDAEGDSMSSIEFAEGSRFDDTFFGTSSYNEFYGLDGDDWFVYSAGNDKYYGGDGFDTIDLSELDAAKELRLTDPKYTDIEHILATDHADYLYGTDADETFQGGKGNDYLEGGLGSDTYIYHRGDGRDTIKDVLEGEGGHQDTLMFGEGIAWNDLVFTSLLQPGIFRITIRGESNTQSVSILNNWSGADGTSNEKRAQIDLIDVGGVGGIDIFDIERADFGNNGESNGVYGLISSGWDHDDVLQGNQFVNGEYRNHMDLLVGYGGNDTLTGHRGGFKGDEKGDIFIGGTGNDTISASKGDDQFVFERGDGQDTITDRGGVDIIQFGPNVAAEDVIVEYYEGDLYIGIRDLDKPALQAHLVADHIKVENLLGVHNWSIEMLSVGGAIINLEQIVVENAGAEAWVWDGYIGSITVDQNQPISNLLGQALSDLGYDPDGASDGNTTFSFKSGTAPAGLQIASNGIISGTPTEEGVHQVTIVATNDGKDTEKTFTLDVQFSNSPPTGSPTGNVNGGNEDTEITIRKSDLLQGFSDANGDSLEIANLNVQNASNGTIQSNGQGDYTLTPNNNYNGTIVLTYDVVDGNGGQLTGQTRSVQIDAVNDAPTGSPMGVIADANEDAPSTILTADLLRGFDDVDSEQLFVEGLDADHGTVVPDGNGNYTLTPDANYNGTITLSYRVSDGSGGRTSIQHQTVQVTAINDAPTGSPTASLGGGNEGADIAILTADLLRGFDDVDSEQLFVEGLDADHGTVASDGNGNYTLTPDANYNGTITLSYRVNDGSGGQTSIHHQTVQISAINDAPTGAPDGVLDDGVEDAPITIESSILLSGFSDVDPDTLSVVNLSSSNGTILPDGAGDFTLTPEANYNGPITLSYQVSDGNGGQTEVHTRELQVTSVNDVPVVSNPTLDQNATEAEAFSYTLPTNVFSDVDIDDILEITATLEDDSDLPHWLSFDNGVFTGTPPAGSEGALSIKVTADDGTDTVSDVFELTVGAGINTAPQAFDDTITATIYEDGVETLTASQFLSNDIDDDVGDTLSITGVDSVSTNGASVALDSDGNVVYDPNGQFDLAEGQTTTDTFNYTVSDGNGGTDTAIATVTVTGRGDTSEPELPEEPTSYIPINGTSGGDHWIDQSGSQLYDGGDGWNSVEFAGTEEDYLFSYDEVKNEGIVLHIASGTYDRVRNINALRFTGDGSQYGKYRYFGLAQGTEGDDQEISIVGTHNAETIYGYGGNDIIEGGRGNDRLDGGSGWDRVNLDGVREDYEFIEHSNGVVVARNIHTGEQDALVNVEGIWFYGEQDDANLVDLITGTTQEPVPEYLNTPIEGNITTGGFQYPILIDLGGDGADLVSVTQSRIVFESDTGGPLMRMGWISAKDGMLVLDRDGDGIINKLSEISFVNDLEGAKTDLEGLRAYDTNFDGVFDAQDDSWALFQVWRDVNQNGIGRGSELASLEEMGISGIRLALTSVNESTDGYADSIVLNEASLITTDGVDRTIYDVALRGELAHVSGYVEGAVSPEWSTFSWTSDGAFGVAQSASNHSGDIEDLAELQTISSDSIWGQDIPLQDLVRYVDYNDELSIPDYLTFSDDDPLTPTFGVKPLVFDLDGNGLDLIDPGQSPIIRDMNGNGAEDRLGWIGSGDGLLALDRNGDGNIDPVSEISFVQDLEGAQTDLEGLVAYDTNNDGWFDADDAQFDQFQIWQDYNYNAISDEGELKSLFEAGIARISLTADESLGYQDSPLSNRVFGQAVFEWNDGTTGLFGDVELRGFSGSEIEQALERERRNNSINANDDIQARLEAMLEAQRRAEELVPNSGETSGVASASVSPESMLSAEDGSNPIERSHMSNINRLDKIAPEIKEGMPSIVQNDLQLTDIGESALSTNTPKRKWWKFGQRSDDVRSTPALGERLAKLDAEKQDIGVETNAQPTPTERQAGELAEKQRLMQAMASFKGSSGVPAVRKRDLDQDNSADIAVAKMNKKSGFGIRSLFN